MTRATTSGEFEDSPMEHGYGANRHPREDLALEIAHAHPAPLAQQQASAEVPGDERDACETVSELATAIAIALRRTKYRRATVEITTTGGSVVTLETLTAPDALARNAATGEG